MIIILFANNVCGYDCKCVCVLLMVRFVVLLFYCMWSSNIVLLKRFVLSKPVFLNLCETAAR